MWETVLGSHGRGGLSFRDNYTSTVKTLQAAGILGTTATANTNLDLKS